MAIPTHNHCTKLSCNSNFQEEIACEAVDLLTPLTLRSVTLRNRIAMSPMCQYCAADGLADDWHLVHLGSRAAGGTGLVMVEATAVSAEGRITLGDLGIWDDKHIEPLARIARFVESQGAVPAIQLAHAGRKASTDVPWNGGNPLAAQQGAWTVLGPSPLHFSENHPTPHALTAAEINLVTEKFLAATRRALAAGFKIIEIHSAHGYLLHSFLSPLSNQRTDEYGGSAENRMRFLLNLTRHMRDIVPDELPLFVRISATDWVEGGWDIAQSVKLARKLGKLGVDLVDCSSGGIVPVAKIPVAPGFQVPFASRIKLEAGVRTGAVGLITEPLQANEIVSHCDADLVFLAREMLRNPYWAHRAYAELNEEPNWPVQYGYAVRRRVRAQS
jgi:2,4-dienoyl-CoA reductase-like NADH-dependent reductase (Old Yellow Enzyme family)